MFYYILVVTNQFVKFPNQNHNVEITANILGVQECFMILVDPRYKFSVFIYYTQTLYS